MPSGLKPFQHEQHAHYITFTCFHRQQRLNLTAAKELFEATLERVRRWYGFDVFGYVVMPEHVHLLVSEPERSELATIVRSENCSFQSIPICAQEIRGVIRAELKNHIGLRRTRLRRMKSAN